MLQLCGILLVCLSFGLSWRVTKNDCYIYPTEHYFEQQLDHFDPTNNKTFMQRFFISDEYWTSDNGPIFIYTGNEGVIDLFINNTGFIWDIAPIFKPLIVFAEHRYYGKSQPWGKLMPSANTVNKFAQLTAEQALADYAVLVNHLKKKYSKAKNNPVIAFGGSYGGMLSAWFRLKYPHIVTGAIASSAPINYFPATVPCNAFDKVVTNDFLSVPYGEECVNNVRNTWKTLKDIAKQPGGLKLLQDIFHLCSPLKSTKKLQNFLSSILCNMAEVDYPYPTTFLSNTPSWPVNKTCNHMKTPNLKGVELLKAMHNAIGVYKNHSGLVQCYELDNTMTPDISNKLWDFMTCFEMVMPFCSNGVTDMFPISKFTQKKFDNNCMKNYGIKSRPNWGLINFGGLNIVDVGNIVFTNGWLDPWHVGGVPEMETDSVISLWMRGAAHHLDMRHANNADPLSVVEARKIEVAYIKKWISDAADL